MTWPTTHLVRVSGTSSPKLAPLVKKRKEIREYLYAPNIGHDFL